MFRHAVHWPDAASVSNPLAVTKAYAARFAALGGVIVKGDARTLHRSGRHWRVDTDEGPIDAKDAVVALGPWAPDVLGRLGIKLPLAVQARLSPAFPSARQRRPDAAGRRHRLTAIASRRWSRASGSPPARNSPTAMRRRRRCSSTALLPAARELFPLGDGIEAQPWMGSRPCFADSRPVIGRAPGQPGLWLDYGHAHWGLTLGPVSGRLIAEMMTGATPFCDPEPYSAERFNA